MSLKDHALGGAAPATSPLRSLVNALKTLDEGELIALRHEIDGYLVLDLGNLNLAEELAIQYQQAKSLLNEVSTDSQTPANQKAQVFNSVRAQLDSIVKQMDVVWGIQRMKTFEAAFLKCLRHDTLTPDAREAFFELYGRYVKDPDTKENEDGTPATQNAAARPAGKPTGKPQA